MHPGKELLGHGVDVCLVLLILPSSFPEWVLQFILPPAMGEGPSCSTSPPILCIISPFDFGQSSREAVKFWNENNSYIFFSSLHGSRHPPRRSVEHTHRQNEDNKKSSQLLLPFGTFLPIHLSICMWQNSIIPQELFSETWSWSCLHIYEYLSIASFLEAK